MDLSQTLFWCCPLANFHPKKRLLNIPYRALFGIDFGPNNATLAENYVLLPHGFLNFSFFDFVSAINLKNNLPPQCLMVCQW
jgi:hypothetical protein